MIGRFRVCLSLVAVVVAILVGCGGGFGRSQPTPTAVPPTSTAEPVGVNLGPVVWSSGVDAENNAPVDSLTTLPNSASRVHASVQAELLPAGVPVQARWTIDGAPLPELDPAPVTVDEDRAEAWITWSLTWTADQPWPVGTLGIVIEVDDEPRATSDIPIVRDREDM